VINVLSNEREKVIFKWKVCVETSFVEWTASLQVETVFWVFFFNLCFFKMAKKKKNTSQKDEDQWWYKYTKEACIGKPVHKKYKGFQMYGVLTVEEMKRRLAQREERQLEEALRNIVMNVIPLSDASV